AVPATAEVVVGADIAKLAGSPVIDRAVEQLLLHNAALAERWQRVQDGCKLDITKQVKRVMLAIGPHPGPEPGTGPVIMVVIGSIPEADLKNCVGRMIGTGGGTVTGKTVAGRTLYLAKDGNRTMYFGYGRPDTIVLGSSEAYVSEALGAGAKAPENPDLTRWLTLVNQNAALWAVGRTDKRVRDGLVRVMQNKVAAGPVAFAATADLADGAKLALGAVMGTSQDAKSLESYVKGELALLTAAAQWKSLGAIVGKLSVAAENDVVQFRVPLTVDDLNQLLSALDGGSTPAQDSAPPTPGSGVTPSPARAGPGSGSGTK
ncbi:MAG: hypothetical protein H7138_21250, partial [Myxococcales bacterium]|nr:hypothetical protein [Myxococcales bacterium]